MIEIMKTINKVALFTLISPLAISLSSCDDAFEPAVENHKDLDQLTGMPQWAAGLLGHAYISNPLGQDAAGWRFDEVATDDAVSNNSGNQYTSMATGAWRADNNPQDQWQYLRASWQYINQFIEFSPQVTWANDPIASELYNMRMLGDAYGMRALYMYHLLRNHAGFASDGQLLGIPVLTESETVSSNFNLPRNTFQECLAQMNSDIDKCIENLPEDYGNIEGGVPSKYTAMGASLEQYNRVFGDHAKNRMNPKVARAVRAQAYLMAASPAYSSASGISWEQAAQAMVDVLKNLGTDPISQLDPTGNQWYAQSQTELQKITQGVNRQEVLWRSNKDESVTMESANFPPTLYGSGDVNPSQNLVDAFPMANGYPKDHPNSGYNSQDPYAGRDPRLDLYIIHNKSEYKGQTIITAADGTDNNALNKYPGSSTRTGYYLKKFLVEDANCDPSSTQNKIHYRPWMRYTEFFLGYAEAANEAQGPQAKVGGANYTAYEVVKAIRQRAGITNDEYLESIKDNKDKMRELIRNERRIELCFEGFRFWDLRRWKADLNETVKGVSIVNDTYEYITVENRDYKDYMYYGPIPYQETLKFDQLLQNAGW